MSATGIQREIRVDRRRLGRGAVLKLGAVRPYESNIVNDRCFPAVTTIRNRHWMVGRSWGRRMQG
jgi:hypothetical protein